MFKEPNDLPILDPKTGKVDADQLYQLQDDYTVNVWGGNPSRPITITVPKGYITDLASIPRWVWTIAGLTPDGLYRGAATVHDYIYGCHTKGFKHSHVPKDCRQPHGSFFLLSRLECDLIFQQLIKQSGDTPWRQWSMYHAVRMFGWMFY